MRCGVRDEPCADVGILGIGMLPGAGLAAFGGIFAGALGCVIDAVVNAGAIVGASHVCVI